MTSALMTPTVRGLRRTPLDARYFDESLGVKPALTQGLLPLARFELPFGYCGSLEAFWQFTNTHAKDNSKISTEELQWLLLINGQPVAPYLDLQTILQPWGQPAYAFSIKLPVNALVEFAVQAHPRMSRMRKSRMNPIDSGVPNRSKRSAFQGRLWNGNPSDDLTKAPQCGAKTRRGSLCQAHP